MLLQVIFSPQMMLPDLQSFGQGAREVSECLGLLIVVGIYQRWGENPRGGVAVMLAMLSASQSLSGWEVLQKSLSKTRSAWAGLWVTGQTCHPGLIGNHGRRHWTARCRLVPPRDFVELNFQLQTVSSPMSLWTLASSRPVEIDRKFLVETQRTCNSPVDLICTWCTAVHSRPHHIWFYACCIAGTHVKREFEPGLCGPSSHSGDRG